jgi:hypothetical protein
VRVATIANEQPEFASQRRPIALENIRPVGHPPYRAVDMDLGDKFAATLVFILGGLVVDEEAVR